MRFLVSIGTILLVYHSLAYAVLAVKDKQTNSNLNNNNNNNNEGRQQIQREGDGNSSSPPANDTFPSQGYPGYGGRRRPGNTEKDVGCKELRSKRYISDGFCTSIKPITEVVCTGHCLPLRNLPWYAEFIKVWANHKTLEHRCVDNVIKRRRVRLMCKNGETRTYKIKTVKSCKCKQYFREQNTSYTTAPTLDDVFQSERRRRKQQRRERRRKERRRKKQDRNSSTPEINSNDGEL